MGWGIWDPRFGIRKKPYPGGSRVQKAPDPRHCMKGKRNIVVQEKFLSMSRPAETEGAEEVGNI
jgi:hypothetical protein